MGLNNLWFKGLDEQERLDAKQNIKNAKKTLDIVSNLVYNIYVDSLSVGKSDYNSPSWAYEKAYLEGQQAAYEKLLGILDTAEEDRALTKTKRKALTDVRAKLRTSESD